MHDIRLTQEVKAQAMELGADLVGVAPVERWAHAPLEHSPQGILPEAKSVISCAVHIPDACVELAAEPDPRYPGTGLALVNVGATLNNLAFRLANWLEERGWPTIAVPQTGYWTYRPRAGAPRGWIADLSHYYAAACAGLGEIGWHNLCITPQFGARQRFITIITTAPLVPDPLYRGPALCDKCNLCARNCPTHSFDKEVRGMTSIQIEDRVFTFPNRNLWRCAFQENFQLDVFLPLPDEVNEDFILQMAEKAAREHPEWIYGWKMGQCLKFCVNPQRRFFEAGYCRGPRRRRDVTCPDMSPDFIAYVVAEAMTVARRTGADFFAAVSADDLRTKGLDIKSVLPDAASAIVLGVGYAENCFLNTTFVAHRAELAVARHLEKLGFSALLHSSLAPDEVAIACGLASREADGKVVGEEYGERVVWRVVVTSFPAATTEIKGASSRKKVDRSHLSPAVLVLRIKALALRDGAHLVGIAPAERVQEFVEALRPSFASLDYFVVEDQPITIDTPDRPRRAVWGGQAMPFNPQARKVELIPKGPFDHLPDAASVIVLGVRLPHASIDWAGKGPGRKAGHYAGITHGEALNQLMTPARSIARYLEEMGFENVAVVDLEGLASRLYSPPVQDLTASRFSALAAGLGDIGWNGLVLTPEFGPRQRFMAIVTSAPLAPDPLYDGPPLCERCGRCVQGCPVTAISADEPMFIEVAGKRFEWGHIDRLRCDWAKRYGLVTAEGPGFFGSHTDFPVPDVITPEAVCDAVRASDRIQRPHYSGIVEPCFVECPRPAKS
jgi:epoxyqueuosine reductase